jgi:hypothetical protein
MNAVPMIYVNPVTGPYAGRERFCYVCALGSAPVVAVFIKPSLIEETTAIDAIQQLHDKHEQLQGFLVCLSGPEEHIVSQLKSLSQERKLNIPLATLPDQASLISIYQSLPIDPLDDITVLLYRGRQIAFKTSDLNSFNQLEPDSETGEIANNLRPINVKDLVPKKINHMTLFDKLELGLKGRAASPSRAFKALDSAATALINEY